MNIKLIFLGSFLTFFGQIAAQENTISLGKKVENIQVINFESMPHDTISKGITRQWLRLQPLICVYLTSSFIFSC